MVNDDMQRSMLLEAEPATLMRAARTEDRRVSSYEQARGAYSHLVKPTIDRVGAAVLLVPGAVLMLVIALAILVTTGRPIIFRQQRVGRNGHLFTVYKFCTMTPDRRRQEPAVVESDRRLRHKRDDDPRVTPLGRVLRRWSLDELPQLWNVVFGDMSLVGPRPELPGIVGRFAPWQHERHAVKPGLTGYWQVYARGGDQPMHEQTDLDIAYVRSVSLLTDLKILALTLPAVIGLKGGY